MSNVEQAAQPKEGIYIIKSKKNINYVVDNAMNLKKSNNPIIIWPINDQSNEKVRSSHAMAHRSRLSSISHLQWVLTESPDGKTFSITLLENTDYYLRPSAHIAVRHFPNVVFAVSHQSYVTHRARRYRRARIRSGSSLWRTRRECGGAIAKMTVTKTC